MNYRYREKRSPSKRKSRDYAFEDIKSNLTLELANSSTGDFL